MAIQALVTAKIGANVNGATVNGKSVSPRNTDGMIETTVMDATGIDKMIETDQFDGARRFSWS